MASHVSKEVFCCLPDEIVVEIISKVTDLDLKALCICESVSRRFYEMACQVDTICFNAPSSWKTHKAKFREHVSLSKDPYNNSLPRSNFGPRFDCVIDSMTKFTRLKSLNIKLPSVSSFKYFPLLKWKVLTSNRIDSFVLLSPTSIHDTCKGSSYDNGNDDHEEQIPYGDDNLDLYISICLDDAIVRYEMLSRFTIGLPFLEKISVTDYCKRGRISLSRAKIAEVMKSFISPGESTLETIRNGLSRYCMWYIPFLELPVSGLVMKGVTLVLKERENLPCTGCRYDRFINIDDDFEDNEEAAYSEAVMEIFKNHITGVG